MKIKLSEMKTELEDIHQRYQRRYESTARQVDDAYRISIIEALIKVVDALAVNEDLSRSFLRGQLTKKAAAESDPNVQAVKDAFPGASVTKVE